MSYSNNNRDKAYKKLSKRSKNKLSSVIKFDQTNFTSSICSTISYSNTPKDVSCEQKKNKKSGFTSKPGPISSSPSKDNSIRRQSIASSKSRTRSKKSGLGDKTIKFKGSMGGISKLNNLLNSRHEKRKGKSRLNKGGSFNREAASGHQPILDPSLLSKLLYLNG